MPQVQKNILLKNHTTFRIGGRAKYFFVAKNKEDLISAVRTAKRLKLPFFILGGGSNLLVSDRGYKGLVIKIQNTKYKIKNTEIMAGAGAILGGLVNATADRGLTGLEWAIGIPGTVGGAVLGNAGAFGRSMKDIVNEVDVLDAKAGKIKIFKNKSCEFSYRDSAFKHKKDLIILSATLQFKKGNKREIKNKINTYLENRGKTQPLSFPSAGSIFKNFTPYRACSGAGSALKAVLKKFNGNDLIPAAYLIEKCGLKGRRIGMVKISEKHANFIVNLGQGKTKDVKKLINLAKRKVKNKFGIVLEEEIRFL